MSYSRRSHEVVGPHSHFRDEETEAQGVWVTCSRPFSWEVGRLGTKPGSFLTPVHCPSGESLAGEHTGTSVLESKPMIKNIHCENSNRTKVCKIFKCKDRGSSAMCVSILHTGISSFIQQHLLRVFWVPDILSAATDMAVHKTQVKLLLL